MTPENESRSQVAGYFAGLDLGQAQDYTTLAVVEVHDCKGDWDPCYLYFKRIRQFRLRHLERMPLGKPYPEMVARAVHVMRSNALSPASRYLAVDATGVGRPVLDLLRDANPPCNLLPALITGGYTETRSEGFYRIPKSELIVGLQCMLQSRDLLIASHVEEAKALVKEMNAMRVEINDSGKETWRSGAHDDLVFAVALACWAAKRQAPTPLPYW